MYTLFAGVHDIVTGKVQGAKGNRPDARDKGHEARGKRGVFRG
jgi:hypothetical protein